MAKFAYTNAKNANTGHITFQLNYEYHPWVFYEEDINPCSKSKLADELSAELQELITIYWENLDHAQELQKQAHNKGLKPKSYAPDNEI